MHTRGLIRLLALTLLVLAPLSSQAQERFITLASTTSTENSGLFTYLLPQFQAHSGIQVRVVAVGTGQAIKLAEKGDADVLLVHHRPSEEQFIANGFGVKRYDVMYNDFVIVGPHTDPAKIAGLKDAVQAFKLIANRQAGFVSRADDSGTHKQELALWKSAGVDAKAASGQWYRETGSGMGATLSTASELNAYTLTDRGTWASFKNKGQLQLQVEGDKSLFNPYGVMLVNPAKHPHVKAADGQAFIDWLISPDGQTAIANFKVDGQSLFFPNAQPAH